jgi:hypothetical protein
MRAPLFSSTAKGFSERTQIANRPGLRGFLELSRRISISPSTNPQPISVSMYTSSDTAATASSGAPVLRSSAKPLRSNGC